MAEVYTDEKGALPTYDPSLSSEAVPAKRQRSYKNAVRAGALAFAFWSLYHTCCARSGHDSVIPGYSVFKSSEPVCPQQDPLAPEAHAGLLGDLESLYKSEAFTNQTIDWLGGAVKIPTENFDDMGPVGEDARWDIFADFHSYLLSAFPLVHSTAELTKVNTYGLVYRLEGSDKSLAPLLLLGHQDVVPVNPETVDEWKFPPFSGHFDGKYIWGRGSGDDKSGLIGALISLETLLSRGFKPTRTVFLASGFDEETGGKQGAKTIAEYLLETYGEDYFSLIVDEGGGHLPAYGARFALPGVGEKGNQDIRIEVSSPGGHSSVPPLHTSIGYLASLLVQLEAHPQSPHLSRTSPLYQTLLCQAEHGPEIPKILKQLILHSVKSDKSLKLAEAELIAHDKDRLVRSLLSTTQAVDLIQGGVKVNALPERAEATVNHRISTDSNTEANARHFIKTITPIALKYNLAIEAFGSNVTETLSDSPAGTIRLSDPWGKWLDPAPVTPTDAAPYKLLSGTIRQTWNTGRGKASGEPIYVAPSMMGGNTDTRYFWNLSQHIFRYDHFGADDSYAGVHTVNEAVVIEAIVEGVRFFTNLILNADQAEL